MNNTQTAETQAADWLARRDAGSWTDGEELEFEQWLNASTLNRVSYLRLKAAWQRADGLKALPQAAVAVNGHGSWVRFSQWRVAASVLLVAAAAFVGLRFDGAGGAVETHSTRLGTQESVTLTDGSTITLNTASRVRVQLGRQERRVWIESGEVFFDVAHDQSRPFVVEVAGQKVTVLGTRFAIRQHDNDVLLTVLEGRVQLQGPGSNPTVLKAGDTVEAKASATKLTHKTVSQVEQALAWRAGMLILDDIPLGEAAAEFNRYNLRKLEVLDPQAWSIRIGGRFDPRNIDTFSRLIKEGFDLNVQEQPDRIIISSRRSGN